MYIMDVIRKVDRLYPNEFTIDEKIEWIDELNAKLSYEYAKDYGSLTLTVSADGTYLLPEWLQWENVYALRAGNREIKKENFTTYGVKFLYGYNTRLTVPVNKAGQTDEITVIYLIPAKRIRVINLKNIEITVTPTGFYIDKVQFVPGDTVNIKGTVNGAEIDRDLCVFNVSLPEENSTKFFVECSGLEDIAEATATVELKRLITDKTICDIPYDEMYIEWIAGKICYWQKNFSAYNQHMTAFNQQLSDFSHYYMERRPSDDNTQFVGWLK